MLAGDFLLPDGRLQRVSAEDPLRVMASACLAGQRTGWDGSAWPSDLLLGLCRLPSVRLVPFCPEDLALGTPRPMTFLVGGNGDDVLEGRARVLDADGNDHTTVLLHGARSMLTKALAERVEVAIVTELSDSCGAHVVFDGGPGRYRLGSGLASALLRRHGIRLVSQRDRRTLGALLAALDPEFVPDPGAIDLVDDADHVATFGPPAKP
jgi:uncharacterized protein YbbK (DUF523 family)